MKTPHLQAGGAIKHVQLRACRGIMGAETQGLCREHICMTFDW